MSIHKVAELAGVSVATVSRVLNSRPRVAAETQRNVRKAMSHLGYAPSERRPGPKPASDNGVRALSVAFLVLGASPDRATPAFQDLLYGVSMAASTHAVGLTFRHVPDVDAIPAILDQRVDGVILHGNLPGPSLRRRLEGLPTVWLMGNRRRPDWGDGVKPDAYAIGELAANYLLGRGHRHLAFLNLDGGHAPFRTYANAYVTTARAAGAQVVDVQQGPTAVAGYWHQYDRHRIDALAARFLELSPRPTGIFVADDMQVALLQPALQAHGVRIGPGPGGAEVVSCNNERPYLAGLSPAPVEIDIRSDCLGRRGVEQLLWRIRHPEVSEQVVVAVAPKLVTPSAAADVARDRPA